MESSRLQRPYYMPVGRNFWDEPLKIHLKHFKRFERRMDRQLRKLTARWQHAAAPNTYRARRSFDQTTVF